MNEKCQVWPPDSPEAKAQQAFLDRNNKLLLEQQQQRLDNLWWPSWARNSPLRHIEEVR